MQHHIIELKDNKTFLNLFMGFTGGGNRYGEKRREFGNPGVVARMERKIKAALHEISDENPNAKTEGHEHFGMPRVLKTTSATLALETGLFKMLSTYIDAVEWLTSGCDEVADLYDALDSAKKEER